MRFHDPPLRDPIACWLRVEVDPLMDLEFGLGGARVYLWIDVIEITFEGRSLDLS